MPSFDIVSEIDLQEIDNVVNQTNREIANRFDFKGGKSTLNFDKENKTLKIEADDDLKLRAIQQILSSKMAKRQLDCRCLKYDTAEPCSGKMLRQKVKLQSGLEKEDSKKIIKKIKDSKLKVQAQIRDDLVRVSGKKIDDLQSVISSFKENDLNLPLQYVNMRD